MASLNVEVTRAMKQGAKRVAGFTGAVRSLENVALEKGDKFTFPESYEVYERKFGDNTAQFIFVSLEDGNVKAFYPSTFTKNRMVYNEDGTPTGQRVHTTGTAAEIFQAAGSVEEGMNALKGKTVVVSDILEIRTLRFGTTSLMTTQIPVIDLVEQNEKK